MYQLDELGQFKLIWLRFIIVCLGQPYGVMSLPQDQGIPQGIMAWFVYLNYSIVFSPYLRICAHNHLLFMFYPWFKNSLTCQFFLLRELANIRHTGPSQITISKFILSLMSTFELSQLRHLKCVCDGHGMGGGKGRVIKKLYIGFLQTNKQKVNS